MFEDWYNHTLKITRLGHWMRVQAEVAAKLIIFSQFTRYGNLALVAIITTCVFIFTSFSADLLLADNVIRGFSILASLSLRATPAIRGAPAYVRD